MDNKPKLEDIIEAMEKNGYKKVRGEFIVWSKNNLDSFGMYENEPVVGACAIGQAALNLEMLPVHVADVLRDTSIVYRHKCTNKSNPSFGLDNLRGLVFHLNDEHRYSVGTIGKMIHQIAKDEKLVRK